MFKFSKIFDFSTILNMVGNCYSRVDVELIDEQVKLFSSALEEVSIHYRDSSFTILEYVQLDLGKQHRYYLREEVVITFMDNGSYNINEKLVFEPPQFDKKDTTSYLQ